MTSELTAGQGFAVPKAERLDFLVRPRSIAVFGASTQRENRGNLVLANLRRFGFGGRVLPVHPRAGTVAGLPAVSAEGLPAGLDSAVLCLPADRVIETVERLDEVGCRTALVVTAGFSAEQERSLRAVAGRTDLLMHGPNCMGLVNVTDSTPLYMGKLRDPLPAGNVALVAQSGSAAIAMMNTPGIGFSKIVSTGNEYAITAADYLSWLARDPATQAIGLVTESIPNPERFAEAVAELHEAGKTVVVLKVGRTTEGSRAALAHTGALVSSYAGYEAFFRRHGVPTVADYDELGAALQCFAVPGRPPGGPRVGVVGTSGGEGALACDVAREMGIELASFSASTAVRVEEHLPGTHGQNPVDFGASVSRTPAGQAGAVRAVLEDEGVDSVLVVQDAQSTLPLDPDHFYLDIVSGVAEAARGAGKPVVMASSTSPNTHALIEEALGSAPIPLVRGLRAGMAGLRAVAVRDGARTPSSGPATASQVGAGTVRELREAVGGHSGPLPYDLTRRLLEAYGIPLVGSLLVRDRDEAFRRAPELGYPLVVKVASPDLPHRSDVGGVRLGIRDEGELGEAIDGIARDVRAAAPHAAIDGFELQEAILNPVEAVAGFTAEPPFGALVVVGSGGVLVELMNDRAVGLPTASEAEALAMVADTRLATLLGGYRSNAPATGLGGLTGVLLKVSALAQDLGDVITEADLNPVLLEPGTGRARVVDALFIAGGP